MISHVTIYEGTRGIGLEMAERLDIAIDVAHAITYLHMYSGMHLIFILKYLDQLILQKFMLFGHFAFSLWTLLWKPYTHSFPLSQETTLCYRVSYYCLVLENPKAVMYFDRSSNYPQRHKVVKHPHHREITGESSGFWVCADVCRP